MIDQIINGYVRNPIKDGVGELPGTTGELFPATRQISPAKIAIRLGMNFSYNTAFADAVSELYTKIRTHVNGHRTYTSDDIVTVLGYHARAYAWYVSQCTLLNAYASCGRLRVANPEKFVAQFFYKGTMTNGIGYTLEDNNKSMLYDIPLNTLRDKISEVARLMDVCIVPLGIRNLIDSYFHKYLLTTKDFEAPEAFIQTYVWEGLIDAPTLDDVIYRVNNVKSMILRTPGVDPANVAQLVSDALSTGITTGRTIAYSDKPTDAFKYDEQLLGCLANITYADVSDNMRGVVVDDFSYSSVYAEPIVYFHGNPNKLETIAGIVFDDSDTEDGNTFPSHAIRANALFTIAEMRFFRWWNLDATALGVTGIDSSHDCYVNTASSTTGGQSYIVQAFINLMLMMNGGLDGLLPTISVQDPGRTDPDHWGILPMRTDHNPNCWSVVKLNSKQHELIQQAVIGSIIPADKRKTSPKKYDDSRERKKDDK